MIILSIGFFFAVAKYTHNVFGLLALGWNPLSLYRNKYGIVIVVYVGAFSLAMYEASRNAYAYKWCAETPEGISTFDGPGKDPVYGTPAGPCTLDQIKAIKNHNGNLAPHLVTITDPATYSWFDGITGKPRVWYSVVGIGNFRFFDRSGTDPATGQALNPITRQIVSDLIAKQEQANSDKAAVQQEAAATAARDRLATAEKATREQRKVQAEANTRSAQEAASRGDYDQALLTCSSVLKVIPHDETCSSIQHDASIQLAHQLVLQGQQDLQQGNYDVAASKAAKAIKLDGANLAAVRLKKLAEQLKPTATYKRNPRGQTNRSPRSIWIGQGDNE